MHIKEITMDGFKCYSQKTCINNLDKYFNAITGMNGSGKSNIIDAIIFVLDLNTSKYMRVNNLKELININRKECTVTLTLQSDNNENNDNTVVLSRSMDSFGKSKFKINNHPCNKNSIESLCKSLKISNDFVIMQGFITKIINMKNSDLKSMIEEVAGTKTYNLEREKSLDVLSKKEIKLKEAREHLKKTINPFFEELKKEQILYEENKNFIENKEVFKNELESLVSICKKEDLKGILKELIELTGLYLKENRILNESKERISKNEINKEINEEKFRLEELKERQIEILEGLKREEENGSKWMIDLKDTFNNNDFNNDDFNNSNFNNSNFNNSNFNNNTFNNSNFDNDLDDDLEIIKYKGEYKGENKGDDFINAIDKVNLVIEKLKEKESILINEILKGGFNKTEELERLRSQLINKEIEYNQLHLNDCNENNCDINNINDIINSINDNKDINSNMNVGVLQNKIFNIKEKINFLKNKINYPISDRKNGHFLEGVFGTVDENFEVDEKYKEAIFTILGNKCKFVICENDEIALKLIKNSDRKISCIPINKIINNNRNEMIENKYKGVKRAISCIKIINFNNCNDFNFDNKDNNKDNSKDISNISNIKKINMEKVFNHLLNGFYIFDNKNDASHCCFTFKVICVTLDGTIYDPKGTLTGGKTHFKNEIFKMRDLINLERDLVIFEKNLEDLKNFEKKFEKIKKINFLKNEIELLKTKIKTMENLFNNKIDLKSDLNKIRNKIIQFNKIKNYYENLHKIYASINIKNKELNEINEEMNRINKKILKLEENRIEYNKIELEEERKKNLIKSTVKKYSRIKKLIEEIHSIDGLDMGSSTGSSMDMGLNMDTGENKGNKLDMGSSMGSSMDTDENKGNKLDMGSSMDMGLNMDTGENKGNKLDMGSSMDMGLNMDTDENKGNNNSNSINAMKWLNSNFNLPLSLFNHIQTNQTYNRNEIENRINFLKSKLNQKLKLTNMDPKNFEILEKNSLSVFDLEEKIKKLEQDKNEILKSIEKLNQIGLEENQKAFNHINKNLKIFLGYFLKNSDIFISNDFEIKVKIGNWKESLNELSGGQKSLIALCLIFSMLTFKPAPFYIFDEIDAALDLNYTQKIGEIIKNEFKGAQFIIVSLKNNMFENANKIFKVFIEEGKSKILQEK